VPQGHYNEGNAEIGRFATGDKFKIIVFNKYSIRPVRKITDEVQYC
jgi:hypothetical protein